MENTTLSESFETLKDPRLERARRHSLINIITIAICAVICGADNFALCFTTWIKQLAIRSENVIAIDGKVLRRTFNKLSGAKPIWLGRLQITCVLVKFKLTKNQMK